MSKHYPVHDTKSIESPPIRRPAAEGERPRDAYRIRAWEYLRDLVAFVLVAVAVVGFIWVVYRFRHSPG